MGRLPAGPAGASLPPLRPGAKAPPASDSGGRAVVLGPVTGGTGGIGRATADATASPKSRLPSLDQAMVIEEAAWRPAIKLGLGRFILPQPALYKRTLLPVSCITILKSPLYD
ncbi:MAG: hypothetical protein GKS00_02105 [Alphaproteobacteria bacterium]|nr:hypothetical protein [Alphaproteobacteria bacterium]